MLDQYYDYCFGELEYRSLNFKHYIKDMDNYQGNAVVNFTESPIPYTRIIEHKHFEQNENESGNEKTVITEEYPEAWKKGMEAYYPINDEKNSNIFNKYNDLANKETNVIFGGRLAKYKYYDMWEVIKEALITVKNELKH